MPITKSAIRRTKRSRLQAKVNRSRKSKYKAAIKQINALIDTGKNKEAVAFFSKLQSSLMKIAKTGVVKRETASRKISRISKKIKKLQKK